MDLINYQLHMSFIRPDFQLRLVDPQSHVCQSLIYKLYEVSWICFYILLSCDFCLITAIEIMLMCSASSFKPLGL